jgi:hypothetical protein
LNEGDLMRLAATKVRTMVHTLILESKFQLFPTSNPKRLEERT